MNNGETVVVFGATGQQGGSVAAALLTDGWRVRAVVRDPATTAARALAANGVETVRGDFVDTASLQAAIAGAHGVFSVQPSSGQGAAYGVTNEDEVRYGQSVVDIAVASGVQHLVYSSANAAGETPSGVGHFDSKARLETYLRQQAVPNTIVRPSAFMEILLTPGLGLSEGRMNFFMRPEQAMQFIAVRDIGRIVARIFGDAPRFGGRTIELAGDAVTGNDLSDKFTRAAGHAIAYQRFPDEALSGTPLLGHLARLVDEGRLAGRADIAGLAREFQGLLTMDAWLLGPGRAAFESALQARGDLALR
jgi:uncharacterized protein YbjT (DUF2867 family)